MDQMPYELLHQILQICMYDGPKHLVLRLRLVCRAFDRILKPFLLRTLWLDFPRLSKRSRNCHSPTDALRSIGNQCDSLNINFTLLRDELEIDHLQAAFDRMPRMMEYTRFLQDWYCMNETTFTELEYLQSLSSMLLSCRRVERLALNLPFLMLGSFCHASTIILANTLKALALRPPEDSAQLKVLVIENLPDRAVCHLWTNPIDVKNIVVVLSAVEHLVITLRRFVENPQHVARFGACFWSLIQRAIHLKSLCIIGVNPSDPPRGLKQTGSWQMPRDEWWARSLPQPLVLSPCLTCLELKRIEISPDALLRVIDDLGPSLEEFYLNEVYLKIEQPEEPDAVGAANQVLWIGLPNQRPGEKCQWISTEVRYGMPRLRVCRASFLGYDHYTTDDDDDGSKPEFDFIDPCGLGRSVSQRFVEVVMGFCQPNTPDGEPVEYLPSLRRETSTAAAIISPPKERPRRIGVADYDTNAHQIVVENTTSRWKRRIDDHFVNASLQTFRELYSIITTVQDGYDELKSTADDVLEYLPLVRPRIEDR